MERNCTVEKVTNQLKLQERRYQAVTEVNVLSPVILDIIEVDAVILSGRRNEGRQEGESTPALSGSKAMAWYERCICELGRSTVLFCASGSTAKQAC